MEKEMLLAIKKYLKKNKVVEQRNYVMQGSFSFHGDLSRAVFELDRDIERTYGYNASFSTSNESLKDYLTKLSKKKGLMLCKIENNPSKDSLFNLAIVAHLKLDELNTLLAKANLDLKRNRNKDLIIEYCLKNKIYDLNLVNEILNEFKIKSI